MEPRRGGGGGFCGLVGEKGGRKEEEDVWGRKSDVRGKGRRGEKIKGYSGRQNTLWPSFFPHEAFNGAVLGYV